MGARQVRGFLKMVNEDLSSILVQFDGQLDRACFEALKLEIERLAQECGLEVRKFEIKKLAAKKSARKKAR